MSNTPETLIILTPGFPENEADTACIPPQQLFVKSLKECYPDLEIVVLTFIYPFFSGTYDWQGVKVISFGNKRNNRLLRAGTGHRVQKVLKRLHSSKKVIGLLSFWLGECAYAAEKFAARHGLNHYSWILGQDAKAGNKYVKKTSLTGDSLIALSDFIQREFEKNYNIKPRYVIPVGVDARMFKSGPVEKDIDVLGAGSLIPLKQYTVFLKVISELKATYPAIKSMICGKGPELPRLQKMIIALGLEDNVLLAGELPHAEVLAMMQRSKAFMHPSAYEGFGAVCAEALYAGAKVVSFVKPMDANIPNWNIAADNNDMCALLKNILAEKTIQSEPVNPFPIENNVHAMMRLFKQ